MMRIHTNIPSIGFDKEYYYQQLLGSDEKFSDMQQKLITLTQQHHIPFAFENIHIIPNTNHLHHFIASLQYIGAYDYIHQAIDKIFDDYFVQGIHIGTKKYLQSLHELYTSHHTNAITMDYHDQLWDVLFMNEQEAKIKDFQTTPFYIINNHDVIDGAFNSQSFIPIFDKARYV